MPHKEAARPQGPLIISISIDKQNLKIYDANGLFAETPVSTGMRGHATPMGVFSVIQKQKFHRSNIYSGAPMPFMQRITWSGIAIHAGVSARLSCIARLHSHADGLCGQNVQLDQNGRTRRRHAGRNDAANFSHPLLVAQKSLPQPLTTEAPVAKPSPAAKRTRLAPTPRPDRQFRRRNSS